MNAQQIELLADIQRLAISGAEQTDLRIKYEVQPWGDGSAWSEVRVLDDAGRRLHASKIVVCRSGREEALYHDGGAATLTQQRDELATFIAANRRRAA